MERFSYFRQGERAVVCLLFLMVANVSIGQESPKSKVSRTSSSLPSVPSVEQMIHPGDDIQKLWRRTPAESNYEKALAERESDSGFLENQSPAFANSITTATFASPDFYTRPLYFEQINFERYSTDAPAWTRPALSYAAFLGTIPILPYKMGAHGPRDRIYTAGHYPYGQDGPRPVWNGTLSKRGVFYQAAATTGVVFVVP